MCHTIPVTNNSDHLVRRGWTPDGGQDAILPPHATRWLASRTGLDASPTPVAPDSTLTVPESALPEQAYKALTQVVGERHVLTGRDDRLGRSGGLSYLDLLRHRGTGEIAVPDAVVVPADPAEVQQVVEVCAANGIGLVPFGGGTSVVGGVAALRGDKAAVVVLDLVRLDRLVSVDPVSRLAVFQAGVVAPEAERLLAAHGLTLGHVPQSFERATIGGFAATRSSGQASSGYGRFEDMVEGVRVATPRGEWRLGVAPASAAGPDLRQLVVGSEGAFGVITEVTVRVRELPTVRRYEGFVLDGWDAGATAVRELAQARVLADVTRLSDPHETDVALALSGGWKTALVRKYVRARGVLEPCLLILGWECTSTEELALRRRATMRVLRRLRPVSLGTAAGESWRHGRFGGPRQRDALMDNGVCVETLETATYWSTLATLRTEVRAALIGSLSAPGRTPIVACHISHAYETGASLYFTTIVPRDHDDPEGQWQRVKAAACAAISDSALGTISHHHAVGVDHAPYLGREIGDLGIDVLAGVKQTLDPDGVLNPGKLIR
ncbi:FAD-binding oxidoreductase [Actinophytocola algeriensis]|uniref:FAD-binding oxidoreductase n=1 Tax=Actinophytocola algeriensis TaxID=1768010 RepID=UPI0016074416|nr:FAD-binding oxidoreductase [Actinophytocola algeriensis]